MIKVNIPVEIFHSFFYSEKQITFNSEELSSFRSKVPFIHEIAYYTGIDSVKPWEDAKKYVPELFQAWNELQEEIKTLFDHRNNKDTLLPMKRGIGYLIELIFWTNGLPCNIQEFDFESLQLKPVNFSERLQFLIRRPNIYPSFAQLIELMEEQNKQYSKYLVITKTIRRNK